MAGEDGGGRERLAPVIPLFGRADAPAGDAQVADAPATDAGVPAAAAPDSQALEPLAPSADETVAVSVPIVQAWHTTWGDDDDRYDDDTGDLGEGARREREIAEQNLLRKLRTRQLSVSEARAVIAERDLAPHDVDVLVHAFVRRGYLDDRALAEQLVCGATRRKAQGRTVIAQSLAKRRIPRDVIDAALAGLPDDDAERALEFARHRVGSMRGLERDVALRRLAGQLARRGYGPAALDAARQALDEL